MFVDPQHAGEDGVMETVPRAAVLGCSDMLPDLNIGLMTGL